MKIVLSAAARQDLLEIWDYIAQDNLDAADRVVASISEALDKIAEMPNIGHFRQDLASRALRFWNARGYLIIYLPQGEPIQVVRVLSGYRDVAALLEADL